MATATGSFTAVRMVTAACAATVVIGGMTASAAFGASPGVSSTLSRDAARASVALTPHTADYARSLETTGEKPIVVGHRGASGYRPELTLPAFRLAIQMGADAIEPDLVSTKDGKLVSRHENEMSKSTNVASRPEFADRRTTKTIDGREVTGWFTEDFTLAEIKTLRAKERLPELRPDNTRFDGAFAIPTLQEILTLARKAKRWAGREIEVHLEIKHSTYFRSIGLPIEDPLLRALRDNGLDSADAPISIQAFETSNLRALNDRIDVRIVQLVHQKGAPYDFKESGDPRTYKDLVTPEGLRWIDAYADGVNVNKNLIVPRDSDGYLTEPTTLVTDAHAEGLLVYAWTFRNENKYLPRDFRDGADPATWGDAEAEYELFFAQGIDGLFSDFPDTAVAARDADADDRAA